MLTVPNNIMYTSTSNAWPRESWINNFYMLQKTNTEAMWIVKGPEEKKKKKTSAVDTLPEHITLRPTWLHPSCGRNDLLKTCCDWKIKGTGMFRVSKLHPSCSRNDLLKTSCDWKIKDSGQSFKTY